MIPALFKKLYECLSGRREALFLAILAVVFVSAFAMKDISVTQDVRCLLPDVPSQPGRDFELLNKIPLSRKIMINLSDESGAGPDALIKIIDDLSHSLSSTFFTDVSTGPSLDFQSDLFSRIIHSRASLFTEEDYIDLLSHLTPEQVGAKLTLLHHRLLSPEGWLLKKIALIDPLQIYVSGLDKFQSLRMVPKAKLEKNHLIDGEEKNVLLTADSRVKITDAQGAEDMLRSFAESTKRAVPPGFKTTLIGAHRYTVANAITIKNDLVVVLSVSILGLLLIFLIFFRSPAGFFVFLIPLSVFCLAAVGVDLAFMGISAVTLGFGAVLIGISADYGIHVYFALRSGKESISNRLAGIAVPVVSGGVTTISALAVMLFSQLPSQRQLAVFSIIGIGASLIISLVVLPHLIVPTNQLVPSRQQPVKGVRSSRGLIISCWIGLLALSLFMAKDLSFNGDLRSLNFVPEELRSDEQDFARTWGDFRGSAVFFSEGKDIQSALEKNDALFAALSKDAPTALLVSLSPLIPSEKTQQLNRRRWLDFWTEEKKEDLKKIVQKEAKVLGFSSEAFFAFFEGLPKATSPVYLDDLQEMGFGELLDLLLVQSEESIYFLTMVKDVPEMLAIADRLEKQIPGVRFISQSAFGNMLGRTVHQDFASYILKSAALVLLILVALFRDPRKIFLAIMPAATGFIFMLGVMGFFGINFNLFNVAAAILIIGLGVDYGIFMVFKRSHEYVYHINHAVLVSGLTTIVGFGSLILAKHPALSSIGTTVLLGIGAAIPTALLVIPAFSGRGKHE